MMEEGLDKVVLNKLKLKSKPPKLDHWKSFLYKYKNPKRKISIGLVGKYVELQDSYKSILEALIHAGAVNEAEVKVVSIHSEHLDQANSKEQLKSLDGLIVAPGFGGRGIEGKIDAITYVRKNKIPFFGICLGMQLLAKTGFEGGETKGLGLIDGEVIPFDKTSNFRIPHVGWNVMYGKQKHPLLKNIKNGVDFYFCPFPLIYF